MMRRFRFQLLDYVAFALAVAITILSAVATPAGAAELVSIQTPVGTLLYPLHEDRSVTVDGRLGETLVEIAGERVRVASDPGPQQLCVLQGWIASGGEWLACLPNRVFVEIIGGESPGGVDGYAY